MEANKHSCKLLFFSEEFVIEKGDNSRKKQILNLPVPNSFNLYLLIQVIN